MAIYKTVDSERLDNDLTAIADSIRAKSGTAESLTFPEGFVEAVDNISTAKEEEEKTLSVTENGSYEVIPEENKALSKVNVDVNVVPTDIGKPYIDTSKMTNFRHFFYYGARIEFLDKLDTSNGTNFANMFDNFESPEVRTIPPLNTSNGQNFESMFSGCSYIESVLSLDTSNGVNFKYLFQSCISLISIPPLDISKGMAFGRMFYGCAKLETISITLATSNLSTDTFQKCTALKSLTIGEGWAVDIFLNYSNNLTVESLHGMIENLADLTGKTAKTFQIGATNLAKIDEEHITMLQNKNWNYS